MQLRNILWGLAALFLLSASPALAQQAQGISSHVAICNPKFPTQCAQPDASGNLPVTGASGGGASYTAVSGGSLPVTAGPNKPAAVDLFSHQGVLMFDNLGNYLDLSGGTAGSPAGQVSTVQGQAGMTPLQIQGVTASGASLTENPQAGGCLAKTAAPTAVTDGQKVNNLCGVEGKQIVLPYALKELMVRGSTGAQTGTGAQAFTGISAPGASLKFYMTGMQCSNTGATTSLVTLNDANTSSFINPAGGGNNPVFAVPLVWAANTAPTANFISASTSQYCSAQGYTGP